MTEQTNAYTGYRASWRRHLAATGRNDRSIAVYDQAVAALEKWCEAEFWPMEPEALTRDQAVAFVGATAARRSPATAEAYVRHSRLFFDWLVAEGELATNPMAGLKGPKVPEDPPDVLSKAELKRLFRACDGSDFVAKRDTAIMRLMLDTGVRTGELLAMTLDEIDWEEHRFPVKGKGNKKRWLPMGVKAEHDLDRYVRARIAFAMRNPGPFPEAVWLNRDGAPIQARVLRSIIGRRGQQADLEGLHPHLFRHTFAHLWLLNGGGETALMQIAGWKNPKMLQRYGASGAEFRARKAHRAGSPADKLEF